LFEEGVCTLYSLVKTSGLRHLLERELFPFAIALLIAQLWFKWGSFALELIGFIAVWLVLGFGADVVLRALKR
jgi:predicted exporter